MADFKIKPAAGTGNKLILESEDGTDVLTTSDSGVAITAPTIADLSNVTGTLPVGVIGGSGLTALGTVTAGDISHADIVYPAGHVIQVKSNQDFCLQSFDTDIDTIISVVMENVLASSICICFYQFNSYAGLSSAGHEGYIYRDSTNLSAGYGSANDALSFSVYYNGATSMYQNVGGTVKDPSPGTGTVNYHLKGSAFSSGLSQIDHAGLSCLTVMEVAQ